MKKIDNCYIKKFLNKYIKIIKKKINDKSNNKNLKKPFDKFINENNEYP